VTDATRLQQLEDREAIRQIFVDYARYLDGGDNAGYASLFARTGIMRASLGDATGPAAIETLLGKYKALKTENAYPAAIHIMNNHDLKIDGDTATALVVWFYLTTDADGAPIVLQAGRYTDDLVREDGKWKIQRHDISRIMGRGPMDKPKPTRLDALEQRLQRLEEQIKR
jgi:ketosteroid isomerase-like protein